MKKRKGMNSKMLQRNVYEWLRIGNDWTLKDMCTVFNVKLEDLTPLNRKREYVTARMFIYAYLYAKGKTLHQIADMFNRDHATVLHSITKLKDLIEVKDNETMLYLTDLRSGSENALKVMLSEWEELDHVL